MRRLVCDHRGDRDLPFVRAFRVLQPPNRTVLAWPGVIPAEDLLVREHHARQVSGLQMPFAMNQEHAHALQHVTAKVQPCHAVFSRQSCRTDGLEAALGDLRVGRATALSATCPVSCVDGARSESATASRSRPLRSRPTLPSFAAASADGAGLEHHDAAA